MSPSQFFLLGDRSVSVDVILIDGLTCVKMRNIPLFWKRKTTNETNVRVRTAYS